MPNPQAAPSNAVLKARLGAQAAANAVPGTIIGEAPEDGTVTSVILTPDATITGATATKRTLTLVNRGQDGAGATVIATLDFTTGTNAPTGDDVAFTLSGVANATNVNAGDVLAVAEAVTSTGTANPGGLVTVTIARR
jgi:hypothetical protein